MSFSLTWVSSPVGSAVYVLLAVVGNQCRTMWRREGDALNVFICNLNPTSSCCYTCPALLFSCCWLCACFSRRSRVHWRAFGVYALAWVKGGCVVEAVPGGICSLGATIANKCSSCNSFLTNLTFWAAFDRKNSWRTFVERALCISLNTPILGLFAPTLKNKSLKKGGFCIYAIKINFGFLKELLTDATLN